MTDKKTDRETSKRRAFELRGEGLSYRAIEKELGISRGTLSIWFHADKGSIATKDGFLAKKTIVSRETIQRFNMQRRLSLQYEQALLMKQADTQFELYKNEPLFLIGVTLYACHGDVQSRHIVRFATAEGEKHQLFLHCIEKYLHIAADQFHLQLSLYINSIPENAQLYWVESTGIPTNKHSFTKPIARTTTKNLLQNGIGSSILHSVTVKTILIRWVSLLKKYPHAVMV